MATVLGKRKARSQKAEPSISQEEAQAIFRRHFEAQFAPLEPSDPVSKTAPASELEDLRSDDDDDNSEGSWDGISGSGSESDSEPETTPPSMSAVEVVEVVSHTSTLPSLSNDPLSKRESKAYLSSRVPSSLETTSSATTTKRKATGDEDAPSLLKNDLALQRLLSESHLFSGQAHTGEGSTEHAGRNRHIATDLRLAALGSKTSIFKQAKMPMSHRKGIVAAATSREAKRRKEARENGIILERPAAGAGKGKPRMRKMERAVDAPAVGRLRNGMLKLSKKDIADIQGDGRRPKSGSGGKRRRR
ncbi:hypothetical protein F5Y04DRAFT_116804 [Hypomontagnella monticulosa]|nr:hypothetical protein F5Y04DRAFT_116804 [Hypomontagnella monticulosa]